MAADPDSIDDILGAVLNQGWQVDDQPLAAPASPTPSTASPPPPFSEPPVEPDLERPASRYTPLPPRLRDRYPPVPVAEHLEPQAHGGALKRTTTRSADPLVVTSAVDIGMLSDVASGRRTLDQVAREAGVEPGLLQSELALALRSVPPEEIAKALNLQAAEQQLKSGALFGVVIAELMNDLRERNLKPDQKMELMKLLAKYGRVEPQQDKNANGVGGGFTLNINLAGAPTPVTIDAN